MLAHFKGIFKNSIIYSIGNFSSKLVGFILLPIYTQYLTVEDYGILGILEVSTQLLVSMFGLGLYWAFNRWYWDKEYRHKQNVLFFSSFVFLAGVSAVMFLIFAPFSEQLSVVLFEHNRFSYLLRIMFIVAGLEIVARIPLTLLKLQEKPVLYSAANISKFVVNLLVTIYFVVYLNRKLEGIYEAQIIGHAVYFLLLSPYIWRNLEFKFDFTLMKEMLVFSLPLVLSATSGIVLSIADRYILKFLGGLSEVGIYSLGFKIANIIQVFIIQSVMLALSPMIYKMMDDPNNKRFYSKSMTYFGYGIMFFVLGLSMFGKEAVEMLAQKKEFWPAYQIIPIIAFAKFFVALKHTAAIGLNIMKKTKIRAFIGIFISVLNIALNVVFIPQWQSIGASIALVIAHFVFFVLVLKYSQKYYFIPFEIQKITKMIIVGVLIISVAFLVNNMEITIRILIKLILFCSFPVLLYLWNFYEDIEVQRVKEGAKKIINRFSF
ncbi:MAG: oligosaccharide flippase family protein [Caldithrix sp.]|nr:oligosaccharide flippase family protein [Caldithrix sp.]